MTYDPSGTVERLRVVIAGPLKMAAYRVCDPETGEMGTIQFHVTYDNHVMALMGEEGARAFCSFVELTLNPPPPPKVLMVVPRQYTRWIADIRGAFTEAPAYIAPESDAA